MEEVIVRDPRHPLYGRKFRVVSRKGTSRKEQVIVIYRTDIDLCIAACALEMPKTGQDLTTKITQNGVADLVDMARTWGIGVLAEKNQKRGSIQVDGTREVMGNTYKRTQRTGRRGPARRTKRGAR